MLHIRFYISVSQFWNKWLHFVEKKKVLFSWTSLELFAASTANFTFSNVKLSSRYHIIRISFWDNFSAWEGDSKKIKEPQNKQNDAEARSKGWKIQWAAVREKAMREWAGVVGKTHGLQGENRSITNFSTKLHSHSFPINAGWRVLA